MTEPTVLILPIQKSNWSVNFCLSVRKKYACSIFLLSFFENCKIWFLDNNWLCDVLPMTQSVVILLFMVMIHENSFPFPMNHYHFSTKITFQEKVRMAAKETVGQIFNYLASTSYLLQWMKGKYLFLLKITTKLKVLQGNIYIIILKVNTQCLIAVMCVLKKYILCMCTRCLLLSVDK